MKNQAQFRLELPIELNGEEIWIGVNYEYCPFVDTFNIYEIYSENDLPQEIDRTVLKYIECLHQIGLAL